MTETPHLRNPIALTERYDTHVANSWVGQNQFVIMPREEQALPAFAAVRDLLPQPFWTNHDSTIACYWRAWELAFGNLRQATAANDFVSNYCDSAFNSNLFMWDAGFLVCFGGYGRCGFDFQRTLDNFYRKQHADGFICREISEADGQDCFPRFDPSSTGPNMLAWSEWMSFLKTGDRQRLELVLPPLVAYHQWTRTYRSWQDGSYWSTGWGSGMDNLPRLQGRDDVSFSNGLMSWVDATLQAALSAKALLKIAAVLGRENEVADLRAEYERLSEYANRQLWNERAQFYSDRFNDGELSPVKHIGTYWALLAGIAPEERTVRLIAHLENPAEFNRAHRVPALAADDPEYGATGNYWCGGVWTPTNFMVLKGLDETGHSDLAHRIALNHVENVVKVYESDFKWTGEQQFKEFFHLTELQFDDKHTLWENYAPDVIQPGAHSKPGYVGWSGLPPIAVLFEDVFGLVADAPSNRLIWRVQLVEEHGVHRYPFGQSGLVDLICHSRSSRLDRPPIEVHSNIPLTLQLIWEGGTQTIDVAKDA